MAHPNDAQGQAREQSANDKALIARIAAIIRGVGEMEQHRDYERSKCGNTRPSIAYIYDDLARALEEEFDLFR